jgi:2'-5' RNA ligase
MPGKAWFDLPAENVIWIREPHPTDPYSGLTPLEAAGIDVEIDWYARLYNRNFLQNDGRPGGLLVLKGNVLDDDMDELRRRFLGPSGSGVMGAGRVSIIEGDDASFVDTAQSPREAAYIEARETSGEQILMAFGVPESVAGNASGRTFDNADQERKTFWQDSMLDHLTTIGNALDVLDPDPKIFYTYDLSSVSVLQLDMVAKKTFWLKEVAGGTRTPNEYREATGELEAIGPTDGTGGADQLYMLTTEASITGGSVTGFAQITQAVQEAIPELMPSPQWQAVPSLGPGAAHPSLSETTRYRPDIRGKGAKPPDIEGEEDAEDQETAAEINARAARDNLPMDQYVGAHEGQRQRRRQIDAKTAAEQGRHDTMCMVCFDPPSAITEQMATHGTEPAQALHITLGVIPMTEVDSPTAVGTLQGAVAAFASGMPPLNMRVAGLGRFHNGAERQDALVALIDSVGITEMRTRLAQALASAGFGFDNSHGFTPHMTLAYLDGSDEEGVSLPPSLTWVQSTITVAIEENWQDYALGGTPIEWKRR